MLPEDYCAIHYLDAGCSYIFPHIIIITEFNFNFFIFDNGIPFMTRMISIFRLFSKIIGDSSQAKMP